MVYRILFEVRYRIALCERPFLVMRTEEGEHKMTLPFYCHHPQNGEIIVRDGDRDQ